jgi:hypothetical protein
MIMLRRRFRRRMGPPTITCILCGENGEPWNDDVFPAWLVDQLGLEGEPPYVEAVRTREGLQPAIQGGRTANAPWTTPAVCGACGTGWMHDLEVQMQRVARPLIDGTPCAFDVADQQVIATWATKTALLYDVAIGNQVVPIGAGCRRFHQLGMMPLPSTQVIIGNSPPPAGGVGIQHARLVFPPFRESDTGAEVVTAIRVAFLFDHLFVSTSINFHEEFPSIDTAVDEACFEQVWPTLEPIEWPPPDVMTAPEAPAPSGGS